MESTAYVVCSEYGYTYRFCGVIAVEHNLALNIGNDASQGGDIINGARNLPDQVTLSVIETDVSHSAGWSKKMLEAMASLKKNRYLCRVVTGMATYKNMLLTEITATQNDENPYGWEGRLTFMQYVKVTSAAAAKENTNSSVRRNTGTTAAKKTTSGSSAVSLLQTAGIAVKQAVASVLF